MSLLRARSLQMRLATRLGALFLVATLVLMSAFYYLSFALVETLSREDLFDLADELADSLEGDIIEIDVDELIEDGLLNQFTHYAVFDDEGRLLVSSDPAFVNAVLELNPDFDGTSLFSVAFAQTASDGLVRTYRGLITDEGSDIGRVGVAVAELERNDHALMAEMIRDITLRAAWLLPLVILLTVLVGVMAIRSGLRPMRRTAQEAIAIRPDTLAARLSTEDIPSEIYPLVSAVNQALERLEAGFELQRRFTANAAHELRTPLAIISSAVDGMDDSPALSEIRQDIARMNRLIEQLLHVARLDSRATDIHLAVDLVGIARKVLEQMAPLAISQGHSIGMTDGPAKVSVQGNRHAIEDAIRNLVENAIAHGDPANTIEIQVDADGAVSVCDRGPGINFEDSNKLFDRFWRGRQAAGTGAGLGLSIVQEIMKHHGGSVKVNANEHGGSCFTLQFRSGST